jgi:lysophospholipase L1-like esterase
MATPVAQEEAASSRWEGEILAFEAADRLQPPESGGILFTGSSSIRLWTSLAADFPDLRVLNRGFGGSQIHEVMAFADRIVFPYRPRLIVIYGGTNDLWQGRPSRVVIQDFKDFVALVHGRLPATRIAFVSIAPNPARWRLMPQFTEVNRAIRAYAASTPLVDYVDVARHMLTSEGTPRPDIYVEDRLHMNAKGYAIWRDVVGEYLRRVASGDPAH